MSGVSRSRALTGIAALAAALGLVFLLSLGVGAAGIPLGEVARILLGRGGDETARSILLGVRLPRTAAALLAGMGLSVSGVILQAVLRNPLADPYLLGVSSGAALGAVAAIVMGLASFFAGAVPAAALAGALLAVAAVYLLARREGGLPPHTLILAGVVISSFCSALVMFLNVRMEARQLQGAFFWIMGGFSNPPGDYLWPVAAAVALGLAAAIFWSVRMNLLTQGEETAASLGLDVEWDKKILFLAACLMTGTVVAISGLIGFVGLVVPHAARMIFGPDHRRVVPAAALMGGSLLILSDMAARVLLAPAELPVGVITAVIGAPFFLYLLGKRGRSWGGE